MVAVADLVELPTLSAVKGKIVGYAQSAELAVTSWVLGDPSERWIEITARAIDGFLSNITVQGARAFFFDLNTDPGDAGDLSADQTPRAGWLSAFGSGWWGTTRGGASYATGYVTITNVGPSPSTFKPFDLTFQRSTAGPNSSGKPTYRNASAPTIYTGLGGTLTLPPSASAVVPIRCEQIGAYGSASPGEISVCVTQSFGTLTVTNENPVVGSDREERATYITRCRQASAAASPNGPRDAYRYASTTGVDGRPLQLYDGSGTTTVNRVYVSTDSDTTAVTIYLANASGPATPAEVSSANANIWGIQLADSEGVIHNADPIGVAPDIATLGPTAVDAVTGAPGPAAAIATEIGPLKGSARIKTVPGLGVAELIAEVHEAAESMVSAFFASPETAPIGGVDQVAGAGVIYTSDLEATFRDSYPTSAAGQIPTPGLYGVALTSPATATTAIALGHVPVYVGPPSISAAADNGSGLVRLTVSDSAALTTSTTIQIYDADTTGGLVLNGTWIVTNVDATHVDLQSSVFPGGGGFASASMSLVIVTVV